MELPIACKAEELRKLKPTRPVQLVQIPEWNAAVYVRSITAGERDAWEEELAGRSKGTKEPSFRDLRARFAALVLSDEAGRRICTDADYRWLTDHPAAALDRIWDAGTALNRILTPEKKAALEGNCEGGPAAASSSGSVASSASSAPTDCSTS